MNPPVPPSRLLGQPHTLVARQDGAGDVLLQGPAVRSVAAGSRRVTMLCSPRGAAAAELLPGVDELIVYPAEWIDPEPRPVRREAVTAFVDQISMMRVDVGVVLTSLQQSPLPLALLLRMAGVGRVGAVSAEYAGSLLDVGHQAPEDMHEVERSLSLVRAMGFRTPPGDDGRLAVTRMGRLPREVARRMPFVVVHPGGSAPARAWAPQRHAQLVRLLVSWGRRVVVTGSSDEADLCALVAGRSRPEVLNLAGRTNLADLAEVLAAAEVVVCGGAGPAHLAAAVGTPVISVFAPVVPAPRWRPWMIPHTLMGCQDVAGNGTGDRAKSGHQRLNGLETRDVLTAVEVLLAQAATGREALISLEEAG
ncbi:MAG TPA: glycosyltransferase family 9 protein [Candidatus Dormibacteraeota bacterium]